MVTSKTTLEFELTYRVKLRSKNELWWARVIGFFWPDFMVRWWTTIRFPFQVGVIAYPMKTNPMAPQYSGVLEHELCHVEQQRGAWGLFRSIMFCFFVPLPVLFSGRWFLEREPYLKDILARRKTIQKAVDQLWRYYLYPWPKDWMRAWFEDRVVEANGD